jgi:DNA (cytosine-5)-methyltransferase 1
MDNITLQNIIDCKQLNVSAYDNDLCKLKVGTLFSGIGAFEHALYRLNINHTIMFACDNDPYVKKSYFENYEINVDNWYDDVLKMDATNYLADDIDIVVGGSPCQSFSFIGKQKGLNDTRGNLLFEFIRIINECRPNMFIFENVKGLTTHDKGNTFKLIVNKFEELTYDITYNILNAADYGVPQSRRRLFLIGTRKDTNITLQFPPKCIVLTRKMQDYLEDNIPDKYYLSDKVEAYVLKSGTKGFVCNPVIDLEIARPILSTLHKMHRVGVDNYIANYGKFKKK